MEELSIDTINPWIPIILTVGSMIGNVFQFITNKRKSELLNDYKELSNIDILNNIYNKAYEDLQLGQKMSSTIFKYYVLYCKENFVDFLKFVKLKEDNEINK